MPVVADNAVPDVLRIGLAGTAAAQAMGELCSRYGLTLCWVDDATEIPGSYWGECEAGLRQATLYARADTPLHSALHEACHYICADDGRRARLDTDAGGDDSEECAVCFLAILLANEIPGFGIPRMLADMDAWGYSFRLGSAARWLAEDAEDARAWLQARGLPSVLVQPS